MNGKKKVVVSLVEMYDTETMYLEVARLLEDHDINHCLPAIKGIAPSKSIVDKGQVGLAESVLNVVEMLSFISIRGLTVGMPCDKCFPVSKVEARRRCGGGFRPQAEFGDEILFSQLGGGKGRSIDLGQMGDQCGSEWFKVGGVVGTIK